MKRSPRRCTASRKSTTRGSSSRSRKNGHRGAGQRQSMTRPPDLHRCRARWPHSCTDASARVHNVHFSPMSVDRTDVCGPPLTRSHSQPTATSIPVVLDALKRSSSAHKNRYSSERSVVAERTGRVRYRSLNSTVWPLLRSASTSSSSGSIVNSWNEFVGRSVVYSSESMFSGISF